MERTHLARTDQRWKRRGCARPKLPFGQSISLVRRCAIKRCEIGRDSQDVPKPRKKRPKFRRAIPVGSTGPT